MGQFIDFTPSVGGVAVDPASTGGEVSQIRLYGTPDRAAAVLIQAGPATRVAPGVYRFQLPDATPLGRYWSEVLWRETATSAVISDVGDRIDLPFDETLVVSPEDIATRLGVPLPITAGMRETLRDAITDAQEDVEGYLGRPLHAHLEVARGVQPIFGYDPQSTQAYPHLARHYDDKIEVVAATVDPLTLTYDVTLRVGLDGRNTAAVVRYVRAHATETVRRDPSQDTHVVRRRVSSVSAEGQSVTYDNDSVAEGAPGRLPALKSLAGFRRLAAYRRPVADRSPWPYAPGYPKAGW